MTPAYPLSAPGVIVFQMDMYQYEEVTINWEKAYQNIKILRLDPATQEVLDIFDTYDPLTNKSKRLIASQVTSTGLFTPAIKKI